MIKNEHVSLNREETKVQLKKEHLINFHGKEF